VTPQMDEPDNDINYLADCSHKQDDHNVSGKKIKRPSRRQANNYADECVFPGFAHRGPRRTQKTRAASTTAAPFTQAPLIGASPFSRHAPRLSVRFFQQSLLRLLLAFNAMSRPGHRLQSLGIDLFAAGNALAKAAFANAR
jgi:hypothetical protein